MSAPEDENPVPKPFLNLLTKDMNELPERIKPFPADLLGRIRSMVVGVEVDLNGSLTGQD